MDQFDQLQNNIHDFKYGGNSIHDNYDMQNNDLYEVQEIKERRNETIGKNIQTLKSKIIETDSLY